jgi:urease accessory protein
MVGPAGRPMLCRTAKKGCTRLRNPGQDRATIWMEGTLVMTSRLARLSLAALFVMAPAAAFAHPGHGDASGFAHGFLHPVGGLDHVLAMVAVGLFAANLGGRALWAVPLSFMALMAAGGALAIGGVGVPYVETGIALSVLVLGAAVALGARWPVGAAAALVGVFAIFHGHAHGTEMPADAAGAAYAAGFVAATGLLHLAGIALGLGIRSAAVRRAGGAALALAGAGLLAGVM